MHGDMAHGIYAENIVEYYQQTGDKHVVFGDVQKITHEAVQEPVETREETDKDVDMEQGDSVVQTKPERVPTEKPLLQMDTYSDREHNDDLEELM
ncbi:pre-mRNA-splicing factor ATP-dependent RNA helicase PRP16, putative [Babesia ovis]|uniref:Pre-mRNA-splicing factor ATP-dependent RNA helicase PRP16, putative n=1 Tax=Babesia ovis TaxID=5869 RepID=A0A9W5TAZ2_BABOV|nr:pre-mRNA-splicing factor ATP-dependent RNA helicase PRP16, putative [Babesia ovis]